MNSFEIDIGDKLGKLTILKQYPGTNENGKVVFLCQCSCGQKVTREIQNLKRKSVFPKSCGHTRKAFSDRPAYESHFDPIAQKFYLGVL